MKQFLSLLSLMLIFTTISSGQNELYKQHAKAADSLYNAKDYKKSAMTYSEAFKAIGWKGTSNDRYNAACSWALAGVPDSAFFQLDRIATKSNYTNLAHITILCTVRKDGHHCLPLLKTIKKKRKSTWTRLWWPFWILFTLKIRNIDNKLKTLNRNSDGSLRKCKIIGK